MSEEQFDEYYPLWLLYVGTDRKHLPWAGGLEDQPYIALQTLLEIDSYYNKLLSQLKEDEEETDGT